MSREDSIAEIMHDIKSLEEQIDNLRELAETTDEPVNMSELTKLQDELDDKIEEMERLENEGLYEVDAGTEKNDVDESIENDKEIDTLNMMEGMPKDDGERRLTLLDWQISTGVELIPDEYIKQKYDKFLTEEEFKNILNNENVPKIIKEPGKADKYLKSPEDWENVRTSKSALEQAIISGNFPVDVNEESYILLQYDKDIIIDEDKNKEDDGYGKIDENDIYGALGEEQEEEIEEDLVEEIDNRKESILAELPTHLRRGIVAAHAKDVLELAKKTMIVANALETDSALAVSLVEKGLDVAEIVGKAAFEKIKHALEKDIENPNPEQENNKEEIEEDDLQPGGGRPII